MNHISNLRGASICGKAKVVEEVPGDRLKGTKMEPEGDRILTSYNTEGIDCDDCLAKLQAAIAASETKKEKA